MFYSETLLSKTGPLARVWLSANLERKLSKTHILQSNIETSVGAIVGQDQAPMALRLSGQLLLGVVRIYSRKARYLLEDCNEALMKIKMAFRPGNVDLPAGATSHTAAQLTLPDVITELDLLLPDPTFDLGDLGQLPFGSGAHISSNDADITLSDNFLLGSIEHGLGTGVEVQDNDFENGLLDDDLNLDGLQPDDETPKPTRTMRAKSETLLSESDFTPEVGRRAPLPLVDDMMIDVGVDEEGFSDAAKQPESEIGLGEDLGLDFGGDNDTGMVFEGELGFGDDEQGGDLTVLGAQAENSRRSPSLEGAATPRAQSLGLGRSERAETSPLSSVRSSVDRDLDVDLKTHGELLNMSYIEDTLRPLSADPEPEQAVYHQRAVRGRRVLIDDVTEIRSNQIKAQQEDRSKILKEPSFLPRDPTLLALLSLQKSRGFAQNVFYPKNIAPELASLLSPEFVRRMAELKRKREDQDEEVVAEEARSPSKQPRLNFEDEEEILAPMDDERADSGDEGDAGAGDEVLMLAGDETIKIGNGQEEDTMIFAPGEVEHQPMTPGMPMGGDDDEQLFTHGFEEESHMPLTSTQPISKQTQAAVHLLRDQFSKPIGKKSVRFQELLPRATTARTDATKMFFEVLVLATKDAISVKQTEGFGDISIKGKKALWGQWAEERDEQQVLEEEEKEKELELQREREGEGVQQRQLVVGVGRGEGASAAAA